MRKQKNGTPCEEAEHDYKLLKQFAKEIKNYINQLLKNNS